jgi:purine-nucleoside phosphorylase
LAVSLWQQIQEAVARVRQDSTILPSVGVVLGSGLGAFAEHLQGCKALHYGDIPHFPCSGVTGHAGRLLIGEVQGVPCAVMSGRVHFYEGHDLERVTFPVRVLAGLGVKTLLLTNAAGGINPSFQPGDIMAIEDHLNLVGANPLRGPNDERLGPRFPDLSAVYDPDARQALHTAAREVGVSLRQGVYVGLAGPSYETPAEIRMFERLGADAVGMSTVAEAIVARHAGLRTAGLSVITNRAAGLSTAPLSHDEVTEIGERVRGVLCELLSRAVAKLA